MANVTGDSAQQVSSYMTAIWNNYAKGSEDLEHFTDVMADLGARTASSSSEIADGLQQFVSLGPVIGLSFDNAAAALAAVSSSTRESAATIGNSFKTIFARLQGLKMGDTLDDGIDLNKYSQALDAIGVNILDQNEELKDADTILEDIMSKWDGLSQKTKVATAQAVAGVHQYSRFMALMEAKDAYHQNLEWAQESDGAVDRQMEYYEESWTAAANRFQDSLNEIYNQLDIADFSKGLLGILTNVSSGAAEAIKNLGGIQPILIAIAGLVAGKFSTQISAGFQNFKQNIITTLSSEEQLRKAHEEMLASIQSKKNSISDPTLKAEIEDYEKLIQLKQQVAEASEKLGVQENAYNNSMLQSFEQLINRATILRQTLEETDNALTFASENIGEKFAQTARGQAFLRNENFANSGIKGTDITISNIAGEESPLKNNVSIDASNAKASIDSLVIAYSTLKEQIYSADAATERFKAISEQASQATTEDTQKIRERISQTIAEVGEDFIALDSALKSSGKGILLDTEQLATKNLDELKKYINEICKLIESLKASGQEDAGIIGALLSSTGVGGLGNVDKAAKEKINAAQEFRANRKSASEIPGTLINEPAKSDALATMLKMTSAATQAGFAITSVSSIIRDLKDKDISGWQKLSSVLINIGMISPTVLNSIKGINNFISKGKGFEKLKNNNETYSNFNQQRQEIQQQIDRKNQISSLMPSMDQQAKEARIQTIIAETEAENKLLAVQQASDTVSQRRAQIELEEATNAKEAAQALENKIIQQRESLIAEEAEISASLENAAAQGLVTVSREGEQAATASQIALQKIRIAQNTGEEISEELVNAALAEGITLENVDIALKYKGAAAAIAGAVANGEFALAAKLAATSIKKLTISMLSNPIFWIAAVIAGVIAVIYTFNKALNATQDNFDAQNEKLETLKSNLNEVKNAYQGIQDAQSTYDEARESLDGLVQGTQEWTDALNAANDKILEILTNFPELWAYVSRDSNGMLTISDEGFDTVIEKKRQEQRTAQTEVAVQQKVTTDAQNALLQQQIGARYNGATRDAYLGYLNGNKNANDVWQLIGEDQIQGFSKIEEKLKGINENSQEYAHILANYNLSAEKWSSILDEVDQKTQKIIETANQANANSSGADNAIQSMLSSNLQDDEDYLNSDYKKQIDQALQQKMEKDASEILWSQGKDDTAKEYSRLTGKNEGDEGYIDSEAEQAKIIAALKQTKEEAQSVVDQVNSDMNLLQNQVWGESGGGLLGQMLTGNGTAEGYTLDEISKLKGQLEDLTNWDNASDTDIIQALFGVDSETATEIIERYGTEAISAFINSVKNFVKADKEDFDPVHQAVKNNENIKNERKIQKAYNSLDEDNKKIALNILPTISEEDAQRFIKNAEGYIKRYQEKNKAEEKTSEITSAIKAKEDTDTEYKFDIGDVKEQAKQLKNLAKEGKNVDKTLQDDEAACLDLAFGLQKMNEGLTEAHDKMEDWKAIIATGREGSSDWSAMTADMRNSLSDIMGSDLTNLTDINGENFDLDLSWLTSSTQNMKDFEAASNGDVESLKRLQEQLRLNYIAQVFLQTDFDKIDPELQDLTNDINSWINQHQDDLVIGATINDGQFISKLTELAAATGQTVQKIAAMWGMTIEPEVTYKAVSVSSPAASVKNALAAGEKVFAGDMDGAEWDNATITVPQISFRVSNGAANTKSLKTFTNKPTSSGSGSKNKGSGSGSEYKPETLDDEFDKYYYYKKSIEDLAKAYDKLSAARDRAYEPKEYAEKTAQMNANIDARLKVYEQYKKELENDVTFDKKYLSGLGAQFDSWGNMTNYQAFMENQKASFQMQLNKAGSSEAAEKIKERWELLKSKVEAWQQRHDDLADIRATIEELENTKIDNDLNSFQFELDLDTTKAEVKLAKISREISHLDHYKLNIDLLVNAQKDELGEMLNKLAYQKRFLQQLQAEAATEGMNNNLQDAILQAQQDIDSLITDIESKIDEIGDDIGKVFDDLNERVDSTKNRISSLTDTLSSMQDILNLAGQKYTENATYNVVQEAVRNANKNNVKALKEQYAATKDTLEAMTKARNELAAQGADDAVLKQWNDKIRETQETIDSLGAEVASAVQSAISDIIDAASEALENSMKMAEMTLFRNKGGDLDLMQNVYDEYEEQAERYLDDTEKAYELSKLLRQVNTSIADKNNITGSKELAKLADEITAAQAEGVKLNQYDVDLLNAKYQLTLAQIALEEAQNSKTTMRLRRDASGNYTYVYTADADAISDAQQNVEDKQKAIYDLQKEHEKEMISSYWNILSQYEELITQLQEKETQGIISHDEFINQKAAVDNLYKEKINYLYEELNKVYDNSALRYEDSVLKKTTGLETLQKVTDESYKFIESITTAATENSEQRTNEINDMLVSLDSNLENLANNTEGYTNQITSSINDMTQESIDSLGTFRASIQQTIDKLKELSAAMSDAYGTTASASLDTGNISGHTGDLSKKYMQLVALGKYDEADEVLKERAGKMATMTPEALAPLISNERLEKWKKYYLDENSDFHKYVVAMYDAVMNGASAKQYWEQHVNPRQFDTGGYTGEWGTDGKLAVLHQKELVLNSDDTERMLAAVQMVRDMSSTITSSLAGDLVNLIGTLSGLRNISNINNPEKVPQMVTIDASFPNVSVAAEIEEAFNDLANQAAQFASIKRI